MTTLDSLLQELQFNLIDGRTAYGDIAGCPVKLVLLDLEPLSLLIGFCVGAEGQPQTASLSNECLPPVQKSDLSVEDGVVWLSLFGIQETSGTQLAGQLRGVVGQLKVDGFQIETTCRRCGAADTPITLQGDLPTRVCLSCLEAAKQKFEQQNRPQVAALGLLPFGAAVSAFAWALIWFAFDLFRAWVRVGVPVEQSVITLMTLFALVVSGVAMFGIGRWLGRMIPSAAMSRDFTFTLSTALTLVVVLLGEVDYIIVSLLIQHGIFDIGLALRAVIPMVLSYRSFYLVIKIAIAVSLFAGCFTRARELK